MAFNLALNDVLEIVTNADQDGQQVINRFDYLITAVVGAPTSTDLLTAFRTRFRAEILPRVTAFYAIVRYEIRRILGAATVIAPGKTTYPRVYDIVFDSMVGDAVLDVGQSVGNALPSFAAVTIRKDTGLLGRSRRGSSRFAGVPEADSDVAGNLLTAAAEPLWQSAADDFRLDLTGGAFGSTARFSLFSAKDDATGLPANPPSTYTYPVVQYRVNTNLGSQVSRKRALGAA